MMCDAEELALAKGVRTCEELCPGIWVSAEGNCMALEANASPAEIICAATTDSLAEETARYGGCCCDLSTCRVK